jgi:hypothetical protein
MHPTIAQLISLDRKESFVSSGRSKGPTFLLTSQAPTWRREIPAPIIARFDRLKKQRKKPVVPVILGICQGCGSTLSRTVQDRLSEEVITCCEQCGRFLYRAESPQADGARPDPPPPPENALDSSVIPEAYEYA